MSSDKIVSGDFPFCSPIMFLVIITYHVSQHICTPVYIYSKNEGSGNLTFSHQKLPVIFKTSFALKRRFSNVVGISKFFTTFL
jgi:hypothetical protein